MMQNHVTPHTTPNPAPGASRARHPTAHAGTPPLLIWHLPTSTTLLSIFDPSWITSCNELVLSYLPAHHEEAPGSSAVYDQLLLLAYHSRNTDCFLPNQTHFGYIRTVFTHCLGQQTC